MRKTIVFLITAIVMIAFSSCSRGKSNDMVFVEGGTFVNTNSNYYGETITIDDFYIGKYEVTGSEWAKIMGNNPSEFVGNNNLPVEMVSWYDCIEYCNKRSIKEGLEPYYNIDKDTIDLNNISEYDDVKWTVTINETANGYRLPTEAEWEYAASGGRLSKNYTYSGSDNVDEIGWHWRNCGDEYLSGEWNWSKIEANNGSTKPVGSMSPNELGLYDMSGNVREWCFDWYSEEANASGDAYKIWKGGGWLGDTVCCELSYRGKYEANGKGFDTGFRVCRNK